MVEKRATNYTEILVILLWVIYLLQFIFFSEFGSMFATSPQDLFSFKFYTLITSIFFHGSLAHILSNSIALYIFGRVLEKHIGFQIFLVFVIGGVIANAISHVISIFIGDLFTSWGASGAIATIILLSILFEPFSRLFYVIPIFILGWLSIYGDLLGLFREDSINQFAHLGGYLGSFLLISYFEKAKITTIKKGFLINLILSTILFVGVYLY